MHKRLKKKTEKKEVVHTRISRPIYLRKQVLKAAIDSTKALKDYNELKLIRAEKTRVIGLLATLYEDINRRMKRLEERDLPRLKEEHKHKPLEEMHQEMQEEPKEEVQTARVKEDSDVTRLKDELSRIESKLKSL